MCAWENTMSSVVTIVLCSHWKRSSDRDWKNKSVSSGLFISKYGHLWEISTARNCIVGGSSTGVHHVPVLIPLPSAPSLDQESAWGRCGAAAPLFPVPWDAEEARQSSLPSFQKGDSQSWEPLGSVCISRLRQSIRAARTVFLLYGTTVNVSPLLPRKLSRNPFQAMALIVWLQL